MNTIDPIKMIDPHCHLWALQNKIYTWLESPNLLLGNLKPIKKDYLISDYYQESKRFKIEKIVVIEAANPAYSHQEIKWLTHLNDNRLAGIVAGIDLNHQQAQASLAWYATEPKIKGVRQIISWHHNKRYCAVNRSDYLTDKTWLNHYSLLKKYHLSFDMLGNPQQLPMVLMLANRFPDIDMILNHTATPIKDELEAWKKNCHDLAKCSNITVKISGFGMLDHQFTIDKIRDQVLYMIDCFGIDRCAFASNFPVDKLYTSFDQLWSGYFSIVSKFSVDEKIKLFYKNAKAIYRL